MSRMTVPALKAALESMSRASFDAQLTCFVYTSPNGIRQTITHHEACSAALDRIEQLEIETLKFASLRSRMGEETINRILGAS